jgi:DNA-directed RNA polymerase subunit omega
MPIEVERDNDKNPVVSLREIASDAVDHESLEDRFIKTMQKNIIREEIRIEDDVSLEDEFAAYLNEAKKEKPSNDSFMISNNKIDDESSFEDISQTLINDED